MKKTHAVIASAAILFAGGGLAVANSTSAEAATQTVYNLKDSTKTFRVYWSSNCSGAYKTVPIGGKVTGGGKYFRSYRQPAYTAGSQYIGVFKNSIDPVTKDTCRSDTKRPFSWEKFRFVNTGSGSW